MPSFRALIKNDPWGPGVDDDELPRRGRVQEKERDTAQRQPSTAKGGAAWGLLLQPQGGGKARSEACWE